jgi:hypothetical protein
VRKHLREIATRHAQDWRHAAFFATPGQRCSEGIARPELGSRVDKGRAGEAHSNPLVFYSSPMPTAVAELPAATNTESTEEKQTPVAEFKFGQISTAVFENDIPGYCASPST